MEIWEKRLISNVPTKNYWTSVREYLLINCRFVRGQRLGDWLPTLNACDEICPWLFAFGCDAICSWLFAFGHTNYARWVPVFLMDMARLPETHPAVYEAFMAGKFVVQRGDKKSSLMALDQSQEHSIQFLKEDSGAKGLYGQQEFECAWFSASTPNESLEHPESSVAEQKKFIKHLNALCDLVKEGTVVNPFNETSSELITLENGEVMDPAIAVCLKNAPTIGKNMFTEFVTDRLEEASKPLSDVIKKNLYTFSNRPSADQKGC